MKAGIVLNILLAAGFLLNAGRTGASEEITSEGSQPSFADHASPCAQGSVTKNELFETTSHDFSWSPDGSKIVFGRGHGDELQIRMVDVGTGGTVCLTDDGFHDVQPSWSPDGRKIVFSSNRTGRQQIHILELSTGKMSRWGAAPNAQWHPAFSPDGSKIAYVQEEDEKDVRTLRFMDSDGGRNTVLHRSPFGLNNITWSRDGSEVIFFSIENGSFNDILTANIGTGIVRNLTNSVVTDIYSLDQSPNGHASSFSVGVERDIFTRWFNYEMFGRDHPGGAIRRLTWAWGSDESQLFSPDGEYLAFMSNRTGYMELYQMRADGTRLRQLTHQPPGELTRLFRTGRGDAARNAFRSARKKDANARPFSERAAELVVNILTARGDVKNAESLAEMFVAAYPESARAFRTRAFIRWQTCDRRALDDYRQAVVREPNEMHTFIQLGPDRYFEMLSKIPNFWRDHAADMNALAYRLIDIGEPRHATTIFQKIIEADPENWAVVDSLAEAFMMYGDYDNAVHYYRESLRLNPKNRNAEFHLSRIESLATNGD